MQRRGGAPHGDRGGVARPALRALVLGAALVASAEGASVENSVIHHVFRAAQYTRDATCIPNNCINPVFPAMSQFGKSTLEANANRTWRCVDDYTAWRRAGFCSEVLSHYQFSIPDVPETSQGPTADELMWDQSREAMRSYVAHLTGMGRDFWQLTEPWKEDSCIQSIWKMACYTYFPRCNKLVTGRYLRPCASTCNNYVKACDVRCCDEGAQCVFVHRREKVNGDIEQEEGYDGHAGPSPFCTGGAPRRAALGPVDGVGASFAVVLSLATVALTSLA
mmetsp:Transcript_2966/g.8445  ORF Transcript_2966/g.8445 Transcript_2966/m.8445 type:complete len:278 (+) Transcript_2966:128-961(+)